jgi:hypothetical protein
MITAKKLVLSLAAALAIGVLSTPSFAAPKLVEAVCNGRHFDEATITLSSEPDLLVILGTILGIL